jgi:hypothetical protein
MRRAGLPTTRTDPGLEPAAPQRQRWDRVAMQAPMIDSTSIPNEP